MDRIYWWFKFIVNNLHKYSNLYIGKVKFVPEIINYQNNLNYFLIFLIILMFLNFKNLLMLGDGTTYWVFLQDIWL